MKKKRETWIVRCGDAIFLACLLCATQLCCSCHCNKNTKKGLRLYSLHDVLPCSIVYRLQPRCIATIVQIVLLFFVVVSTRLKVIPCMSFQATRKQVDKETRRRDIVTVRVWGRGESHAFDTYRDLSLDSKHLRGFRVWYNTERSSLSWRRRQTRSYMKLDRITHARPNRSHTPHIQEANRCIRWFTFAHAELRSHSIQTKNWYEDTNICFSMWSPKNREQ